MKRNTLRVLSLLVLAALVMGGIPYQRAQAAPTELFFSEYIEGSSNNKALEIYNGTGSTVDLAAGNYIIAAYNNGSTSATTTVALTGSVANNDVYVLAHGSAVLADIISQADQLTSVGWFNGDDAVVLWKGGLAGTVVDVIGQVGFDPGTQWGTDPTSTMDNTIVRKATVCAGDTNTGDVFSPATEWDGYVVDVTTYLGSHTASCGGPDTAPNVSSTAPADNATGVALGSDIVITFTEAVNVTDPWVTLSCDGSPATFAISGGSTSWTLNPDSDFAYAASCTVTVSAAQIADQDTNDPPDLMSEANPDYSFNFTTTICNPANPTLIHTIQGTTDVAPGAGSTCIVEGIVVGDLQAAGLVGGFIVQEEDAEADLNPLTSEGLYVYNATAVSVGDKVRVTGTVTEFGGMTEISPATLVSVLSSGNPLPTVTDVPLPFASNDAREALESMYVRLDGQVVTELYELARYGSFVVSSGDRLYQPTSIAEPGAPALAMQAANDLNRIYVDDRRSAQNPDPLIFPDPALSTTNRFRIGDTINEAFGVMFYSNSAYRVHATSPVTFTAANPQPALPPDVGGNVKVASANLLNFFNGDGGTGGWPSARGAESEAEWQRQYPKTIAALAALDADIIGLMEMENDSISLEYSALEELVDLLNAQVGAGTYTYVTEPNPGTDAIKVSLIYKPAVVTPLGAPVNDTNPIHNRPPLAQTFSYNGSGEIFTVVVNHFKSKGCDLATGLDMDQGDGQSCYNYTRTLQSTALLAFISTLQSASEDADVLVIGDLNSYAKEDPIDTLIAGGLVELVDAFNPSTVYSYVFGGQSGYLDHALATASLFAQATDVKDFHINADEATIFDYNTNFKTVDPYLPDMYRMSDHDPLLIGFNLFEDDVYVASDLNCDGNTPCFATIAGGMPFVKPGGNLHIYGLSYAEDLNITSDINVIGEEDFSVQGFNQSAGSFSAPGNLDVSGDFTVSAESSWTITAQSTLLAATRRLARSTRSLTSSLKWAQTVFCAWAATCWCSTV